MADPNKSQSDSNGGVQFLSEDDVVEVREEDTEPGPKMSESQRRRLAEKYGVKLPPPAPPGEDNAGPPKT